MHYIYIIESLIDQSYYKGYSLAPDQRLIQHNEGKSAYTSHKKPWKLIYVEIAESKKDALIREKALKKYGHDQIKKLIASPKNIVNIFT